MQNTIIFITGRKGCGKTTLAAKTARKLFMEGTRVLAVAPMGGFSLPGAAKVRGGDHTTLGNLRGRSAVVLPECDDDAERAFDFVWALQEDPREPIWLFVDEVQLYLGPHKPNPSLMKIVTYGRHRRISFVGITMMPAMVHKSLPGQADIKIIFQTTEPNALDYLRRFAGVDPESVAALSKFDYLVIQ